jgi:hypothetical protein
MIKNISMSLNTKVKTEMTAEISHYLLLQPVQLSKKYRCSHLHLIYLFSALTAAPAHIKALITWVGVLISTGENKYSNEYKNKQF